MINGKKVSGIILTAGNSVRYGKDINKNFEIVNDKMLLTYSLDVYANNEYIDEIILVYREEDKDTILSVVNNYDKKLKIVLGGSSRKESVYNGISNSSSDIVIIHDAARPCIKNRYINDCLKAMDEYMGVTIGVKAKDTIKVVDDNSNVLYTTLRSNTYLIQTPQCFHREILLNLHDKYINEDVTDDCMLLEKDNYKVKIIDGDYTNIKITTIEDLRIIKEYLNEGDEDGF